MRREIQVETTAEFDRDYGWMLRQQRVTADEVLDAMDYFRSGLPLPEEWQDHALHGGWKGHREFHLSGSENNLIIYRARGNLVIFVAMGSHEDLFRQTKPMEARLDAATQRRGLKQKKERSKSVLEEFRDWVNE